MATQADVVWQEVRAKWTAYLRSGLPGYREQVIDRLAALGVRIEGLAGAADPFVTEYLEGVLGVTF